jgi:NAD-dependent SIR2 family protein deacetylase
MSHNLIPDGSVQLGQLAQKLENKKCIWILTGAGISANSGIPTYRDDHGKWQHNRPIQHDEFINQLAFRQKYWARSLIVLKNIVNALPNSGHKAVTAMQHLGRVSQVATQNVDRLHSLAGTKNVIDLHGRLDKNICLDCGNKSNRNDYQDELETLNPEILATSAKALPDGDADISDVRTSQVSIPSCILCGGIIMPNVVFFGGSVPKFRVEKINLALAESDCVLVLGSSISVYSGFRFLKQAYKLELPLYAINKGIMRGAELFDHIVTETCETALPTLVSKMKNQAA